MPKYKMWMMNKSDLINLPVVLFPFKTLLFQLAMIFRSYHPIKNELAKKHQQTRPFFHVSKTKHNFFFSLSLSLSCVCVSSSSFALLFNVSLFFYCKQQTLSLCVCVCLDENLFVCCKTTAAICECENRPLNEIHKRRED